MRGRTAIILVVGCVAVFTAMAVWVNLFDSASWERAFLLRFREATDGYPMRGPSWLPEILRDLTSLAGVGLIALVALVVVVYLALNQAWRAIAVMAVVLIGTQATVTSLKFAFSRSRPDFLEAGANVSTHSFPSGHAAMAAATALLLAWSAVLHHPRVRMKVYFWTVATLTIGLIGFSRVYLGVHYPSDVLAGWATGTAWAAAGMWLGHRIGCCAPDPAPRAAEQTTPAARAQPIRDPRAPDAAATNASPATAAAWR